MPVTSASKTLLPLIDTPAEKLCPKCQSRNKIKDYQYCVDCLSNMPMVECDEPDVFTDGHRFENNS